MVKFIGHFTSARMLLYVDKKRCFSSQLVTSLTCFVFLSGLLLPVCQAQSETNDNPESNLQGKVVLCHLVVQVIIN